MRFQHVLFLSNGEMLMDITSGIYKILNIETGDFYIGSSKDIHRRKRHHKNGLRRNIHHNTHLQNAWNKYTEQSFLFETMELVDITQLEEREQYYINTLNPKYNLSREVGIVNRGPKSEEHKKKISESEKGKIVSEETRKKISEAAKRQFANPQQRQRLARLRLGSKATEETKKKMSESGKLRWQKIREQRENNNDRDA